MEAIILAGGFGTRLRSVVGDRPKPMAQLGGRPFLAYLLDRLETAGFTRVILGVGYLAEQIIDYFGNRYAGMDIIYSRESEPLGTGGAVRLALRHVTGNAVFVLNGDTLCEVDYRELALHASRGSSDIVIAVKHVDDTSRYGTVIVRNGFAVRFEEKKPEALPGYINVGTYLLQRPVFPLFDLTNSFSFERDLLEPRIDELRPVVFPVDGYFVDIGIPDDYLRAQSEIGSGEGNHPG